MTIRPARAEDREAIAAIQSVSPEAARWDPAGYDVEVAEVAGRVVGFLVTRALGDAEFEILNLAVAPPQRRAGIARALVRWLCERVRGDVFLEVRESNLAARKLYQSLQFQEVSRRPDYYDYPSETGIVMKFHSC